MNFQHLIFTLQKYWSDLGCVLLQPHDQMMGAGTFHPATVLRSLGPAPWRCGYVQPCRRPSDARYGDNPFRLGHYYQYQVILKPSPKDVQDLYLGSLKAIGVDLKKHDVRFVEDDWESPTLGAWGLGWEVWLNGMEVSQFTYFQQVGGVNCRPFPAELTYGLERLAMTLQGVESVYDLEWVDGVSYGDVFSRNEVEQSKYNFEQSDPDTLFTQFNLAFNECERLAGKGLSLPAYEQCIATSHTFNLLDARGLISVAERAQYIRRIRQLTCLCAEAWVAGIEEKAVKPVVKAPVQLQPTAFPTNGDLVVELFCEELPASEVRPALGALEKGVLGLLHGVNRGDVATFSTPRRLAVVVKDVALSQAEEEAVVTGPPADRAFDKEGKPTKAGAGFARGRKMLPEDLFIVDGPRGEVAALRVRSGGVSTDKLLSSGLDAVVRGLPFKKTMEWGAGGVKFSRPLHNINVVLHGVLVQGIAADLPFTNTSFGHRLSDESAFTIQNGEQWMAALEARMVDADLSRRKATIKKMLVEATATLGCDVIDEPELVEEVLHLVEAPTLVLGEFDEGLLQLPARLLVQTMKKHQRYFPVFKDGALTNHFVIISNNPMGDDKAVARGNAMVLLARFEDARFFLAEDKKRPLEDLTSELAKMRWIRGLGNMAQKAKRAADAAVSWANVFGVVRTDWQTLALCKNDLVTFMVGEFAELQGHMGHLYALDQGHDPVLSLALEEHYLPRFASDLLPTTTEGTSLAIADRLDTLICCFSVAMKPKGGDPQGLRRAAMAVVNLLIAQGVSVDLTAMLSEQLNGVIESAQGEGFELFKKAGPESSEQRGRLVNELIEFMTTRFRAQEIGRGTSADLVDSMLNASVADPIVWRRKLDALVHSAKEPGFRDLMITVKRVQNITADSTAGFPEESQLTDDAERALHNALVGVEEQVHTAIAEGDFLRAFAAASQLGQPVATFFDSVMVLCDDPTARQVRLGLLRQVAGCFSQLADFSKVSSR